MTKTVPILIDNALLAQVDRAAAELGIDRSTFVSQVLKSALKQIQLRKLEAQHRAGYERRPLTTNEFDIWQNEQSALDVD